MLNFARLFRPAMVLAALSLTPASTMASDYKSLDGKTVRVIISASANGNNDMFARLLVKGLETRLPETTFAVQNMPGGNGALALNETASSGPDAITLVQFHTGPVYADLAGVLKSPIKMTDLQWIGSLSENRRVMLVSKALADHSLEELKALGRPLTALVADAGTPSEIETMTISSLTGLDMRLVIGVEEDQRLALLLAGDGDVVIGSYDPKVAALVDSGDIAVKLMIGKTSLSETFPDVPVLAEVVDADAPKDLLGLMESLNLMGRLIAAAPNTDPAVVADLRAAFDSLGTDPAFLATYTEKKQTFTPVSGAEVAKRIDRFVGSAGVRDLLKKIVDCGRANDGQAVHCSD